MVLYCLVFGLVFGLTSLLPGKHERNYSFFDHLATYPIGVIAFATIVAFVAFRDEVSLRLHEGGIFLMNLSLIYLLSPWHGIHKVVALVALLPTIFVAICAFFTFHLSDRDRFALGLWGMLMSIVFSIQQVLNGLPGLRERVSVLGGDVLAYLSYWIHVSLLAGSFVLMMTNLMPIIGLLRGKSESQQEYLNRLKQEKHFIRSCILETQIPTRVTLFITFVHGLPLLANWQTGKLANWQTGKLAL
ncbi:MAG: hypothetical protein AB7G93_19545 [Bdellovibrionales bacterium]